VHLATYEAPERPFVHGDAYIFAGKTLRWLRPPADGTVLVIRYEGLTEWVAFSSPFEVIDRGGRLGQRALLRRKHLLNLRESPRRDAMAILSAPS
jgi:hypothetical protein